MYNVDLYKSQFAGSHSHGTVSLRKMVFGITGNPRSFPGAGKQVTSA